MTLEDLRAEVDTIDADLVALLARRRAVVGRMAAQKRATGLSALDGERETALAARWGELATAKGLPAEAAQAVLEAVLVHSRAHVRGLVAGAEGEPTP